MAQRDRAIIVGIRHYPGLSDSDLDGPENDARAFHEWVTSKSGGDVPGENAQLILSSDYPTQKNPVYAEPAVQAIQRAIDELHALAETNRDEGNGYQAGRRLYLYFSGHGFEPQPEQVALLTANATRKRGYHVAGRIYADFFRRSGIFEEVLLFMDCCREPLPQIPLNIPPYILMQGSEAPEKGKWLVAYATKWSRKSRERMIEGKSQGIFTAALLKGLKGLGHNNAGSITDESLANYLYDHMKDVLTEEERKDPDIPQQPDIDYDKDPNNRIEIVAAPTGPQPEARCTVVFKPRPEAMGKALTVLDSGFTSAFQTTVSGASVETQLSRGFYLAQIMAAGVSVPFQVPSNEPGGVTHVVL